MNGDGEQALLVKAKPEWAGHVSVWNWRGLGRDMGLAVSHVSTQQPDQRAFEEHRRIYEDLRNARPDFEASH